MLFKESYSIENQILEIVQKLFLKWMPSFKDIGVEIGPIGVSRYGKGKRYFSEIEMDIWDASNENLECFSIIIFSQGEQVLDIDNAGRAIENEINNIYRNLKTP